MLEPLLGSISCERVLLFILSRQEGYAREMARFYEAPLYPIQKQLEKLELGGVLVSRAVGRTRLYMFNPRYPFLNELRDLLEKALSLYPEGQRNSLLMKRRSPRSGGQSQEDLSKKWNPWQPET